MMNDNNMLIINLDAVVTESITHLWIRNIFYEHNVFIQKSHHILSYQKLFK
jgi:hypothetical protein